MVGAMLVNDLAVAALDLDPDLREVLDVGLAAGALGAVVSGSGPTCAFLVANDGEGLRISQALDALPQVKSTKRAVGPQPGAQLMV